MTILAKNCVSFEKRNFHLGFVFGRATAILTLCIALTSLDLCAQVTIPSSTATGVALASAANYKLSKDNTWRDYEDVVIIAALNCTIKMAVNTGRVLKTTDYTNIANQVRAWLDGKVPQNPPRLTDHAVGLRYAIDLIAPLASGAPSGSLWPPTLADLEDLKSEQLEIGLDPSRQTPADPALYSVAVHRFVDDRLQEDCDLGQNDPVHATAVNPFLHTTISYSQIQQPYPNAIPLFTVNGDGSLTIDSVSLKGMAWLIS
jgi:hypothetical protein